MILNKATIEDYESIIAFYDDVTDRTPDMEQYARWKKGLHPTHDGISAYIEEGSMYLYKENDAIVGAMAVTWDAMNSAYSDYEQVVASHGTTAQDGVCIDITNKKIGRAHV